MGGARVLPLRPVGPFVGMQRHRRRQRAFGFAAKGPAPSVVEGEQPHAAPRPLGRPSRRLARGAAGAAPPAGGPMATAVMPRAGVGADHHRAHPVALPPVFGHAPGGKGRRRRRETVHPHTGKQQEAVVADGPWQVPGAGVSGPADGPVTRPLVPARRRETEAAQPAVGGRHDPVPQLATRRARPALRVVAGHHRLPAPPVHIAGHRPGRTAPSDSSGPSTDMSGKSAAGLRHFRRGTVGARAAGRPGPSLSAIPRTARRPAERTGSPRAFRQPSRSQSSSASERRLRSAPHTAPFSHATVPALIWRRPTCMGRTQGIRATTTTVDLRSCEKNLAGTVMQTGKPAAFGVRCLDRSGHG